METLLRGRDGEREIERAMEREIGRGGELPLDDDERRIVMGSLREDDDEIAARG